MTYFQQVQTSLAAWCQYLDRPRVAIRAVLVLLFIHTGLLAYSAYVHSPTLNEPGHLVAGLSHWKFGRFELYRVNPPLVRMVAALPVMAAGYETDWSGFHQGPGARPVFGMGSDFVAANGERSFFLFMISRWACIPFSWIGALTCYLWARDLYGRPSGVMACALWCFSPNILAHASLITADVGGTALGVAACYTFWRWLKEPTWTQAALTGIVLGLAELAKTTLILLYPLWPLLWVAYRWPDRNRMFLQDWFREAGMLILRMAIGLYVLNLGYGFEGSLQPLNKFHFVSDLLTGRDLRNEGEKIVSGSHDVKIPRSEISTSESANRFADTWLGNLVVPFPRNYLLGVDVQQRDFERYYWPSYLRGQWQDHGWWYYYLYAVLIKVPLGTLILGFLGLVVKLTANSRLRAESIRETLILLALPLFIFVVCSCKTGFSEHFRYVLPCFPFAFIWLSGMAMQLRDSRTKSDSYKSPTGGNIQDKLGFTAVILLLWAVTSSLWTYPHCLSYFNESIGGPINGHKHLLGSNVDWGQDLRYLKWSSAATQLPLACMTIYDPRTLEFNCIGDVDFLINDHEHSFLADELVVILSPLVWGSPKRVWVPQDAAALGRLKALAGTAHRKHRITYSLYMGWFKLPKN